jgi:hypothetical protein
VDSTANSSAIRTVLLRVDIFLHKYVHLLAQPSSSGLPHRPVPHKLTTYALIHYLQTAAEDHSESDSEQPAAAAATAAPQQQELLTPAQYRRKFQMCVDAADAPEPHQTFEQAELPAPLLNAVSLLVRALVTNNMSCILSLTTAA